MDGLIAQVEHQRRNEPTAYFNKNINKNASQRLATIYKLVFEALSQDPTRVEYRQGDTLGDERKHWFGAKFFQQYRLFFRYDLASKVIVFAWVNDDDSKRAYGCADDAYRTFRRMLQKGKPPDDWQQLLAEAKRGSQQRPLRPPRPV